MINPGQLSLDFLRQAWQEANPIEISSQSRNLIHKSAQMVEKACKRKKRIYGVNTGFGRLANVTINEDDIERLQRNLILSHCCGTGNLLSDKLVSLILLLKINSLAQGYSGVSTKLIDALIALYNHKVYPCIPSKGSVGASGDLAPLAHLSAILIEEGEAHYQGKRISAKQGLMNAGLQSLHLLAKEGLALVNGLQVSAAQALEALFLTEYVFDAAMMAGALSIEAIAGSIVPFDARIHDLRNHPEQQSVARIYKELLKGSAIQASHMNCHRVQDPYSLRCQPQVMGACLSHIHFSSSIFLAEANAVSDNPLVFVNEGDILSGGNFHGQALSMAADNLALAISEIGAMSERRIALLMDTQFSELPMFLVNESGLNSGFMLAQVTAAALASENKSLAHPASVDSIPTSANQEDHVSMANYSSQRLKTMVENTATIIAIELLAATQGLDFRHPLKTSAPLEMVRNNIREKVAHYEQDRSHSPDIETMKQAIISYSSWLFPNSCKSILNSLNQ